MTTGTSDCSAITESALGGIFEIDGFSFPFTTTVVGRITFNWDSTCTLLGVDNETGNYVLTLQYGENSGPVEAVRNEYYYDDFSYIAKLLEAYSGSVEDVVTALKNTDKAIADVLLSFPGYSEAFVRNQVEQHPESDVRNKMRELEAGVTLIQEMGFENDTDLLRSMIESHDGNVDAVIEKLEENKIRASSAKSMAVNYGYRYSEAVLYDLLSRYNVADLTNLLVEIDAGVIQIMNMGFHDNEDHVRSLLLQYNGDVNAVLDIELQNE
eukprot:TRINITY_DN1472_c0_g2_i1.p1 TRINITY_DN1472_c0_g2~~TRINITY_DN1472_c0_g2_i1.p1  ORF type:complete len:268 (+),score=71.47 TRINITY_DN1472_c0_g2_i1:355-1158(+)